MTDLWQGVNNITTDPAFTSRVDGSEDYQPAADNGVLVGAGFPGAMDAGGTGYMDIGALQRQMASGGGGGGKQAGSGGGQVG